MERRVDAAAAQDDRGGGPLHLGRTPDGERARGSAHSTHTATVVVRSRQAALLSLCGRATVRPGACSKRTLIITHGAIHTATSLTCLRQADMYLLQQRPDFQERFGTRDAEVAAAAAAAAAPPEEEELKPWRRKKEQEQQQ